MSEDLISNNFVDNVNRIVIKKTFNFSKAVLTLTIVYSILELTNWYIAISDTIGKIISSYSVFFNYRIIPVIAVILLSMGIVSWGYCVKANKLIELSFQKNDANLFNKGYELFYKSARLIFASFSLAIVSVVIRLLLN